MFLTINISLANVFTTCYILATVIAAKLAVCEMAATLFEDFRRRERARAEKSEFSYGAVSVAVDYIVLAVSGVTILVFAFAAGRLDIGGILILVASAKAENATIDRAVNMIDCNKDCGSYWLGAMALGIRLLLSFDIIYLANAIANV